MSPEISADRLEAAYQTALTALLNERAPTGHWIGELSTSALSTATAVMALHLVQKHSPLTTHHSPLTTLIERGLTWLSANQNPDGGWGDTTVSKSNISTTMLCRAAFYLCTPAADRLRDPHSAIPRAEAWLTTNYGPSDRWPEAIRQRYGKDRTFATPILTTCALAGLVSWDEVPPLPFELAVLPQSWFRFLRLHVVSYALPALIAIGQCIYHYKKPWNPITRLLRRLALARSLRVLQSIQPSSGGFLEAIPLTSFVTLSLAACGLAHHEVTKNGIRFLVNAVRPDGSWAIDSNLATWVTTLSVNALATAGELDRLDKKDELRDWLLNQQYKERHPYTGADPGGWAWTDLPGGVPDADDTAGAILALLQLGADEKPMQDAMLWLLALQNRDGGTPTFCRGWGHLPFDRSGTDLTAHFLRSLRQILGAQEAASLVRGEEWAINWGDDVSELPEIYWLAKTCIPRAFEHLASTQRPDGSWLPLWFGNQHMPDDENPTYGTARVLAAYRDLGMMDTEPAKKGIAWLAQNQNLDGGWGGGKGSPSSIEETALALDVLIGEPSRVSGRVMGVADTRLLTELGSPVNKGIAWLVQKIEEGGLSHPTPIGFYFAKLWYFEKLYPIIFSVSALGRARQSIDRRPHAPREEPSHGA